MKEWRNEIEQHILYWSERLRGLHWWPRYVYHFTDVNNASSIIQAGHLFSRMECQRQGLMVVDNANSEIIQQTKRENLNFVRLYFRPRTPTQFRNEGIRPLHQRDSGGAHCPIPVFFCFDALDVLSLDSVEYSNGNIASNDAIKGRDRDFFFSIPFQHVFHDGAFSRDLRDTIVFHRHAEVLVPSMLSLRPYLKFIACRSTAERQTLLHLLPENIRHAWSPFIRISDVGLFERKWTFIEEVVVIDETVVYRFNPNSTTPEPFTVRMEYQEDGDTTATEWHGNNIKLNGTRRVRIVGASRGKVRLYLDNALAFADTIIFDDVPF